jgi:hypothetical protein
MVTSFTLFLPSADSALLFFCTKTIYFFFSFQGPMVLDVSLA